MGSTRWELKIGLVQVVVLIGVATGSMVGAFFFGHLSGQKVGYDRALESSLANTARYPITGDAYKNEISPESVTEVYAKLNESKELQPAAKETEVPELASIKSAKEAPVIEELASVLLEDEGRVDNKKKGKKAEHDSLLGLSEDGRQAKDVQAEPSENLGALLKKSDAERAKAPAARPTAALQQEKPILKQQATEVRATPQPKKAAVENENAPAAKAAAPQKAVSKVPSGWYAQVAAPQRFQDAERLAEQLRNAGFPALVESANVNGQAYYRVLAGPERSRVLADRLVKQLLRENIIKNKPFTRVVP